MKQAEYLNQLSDLVVEMEDEAIVELVDEYVAAGYDIKEGMTGLIDGMNRCSELYEQDEYFIPELILCSDAMYAGINQFKSYMEVESQESLATVVLGVPEGDTHDIGKSLVKLMLETAGFRVIDLGRDVPCQAFIDTAIEHQAQIIGLSTLMSTTMKETKKVVDQLKAEGLHPGIKVIIGGAPITQKFATEIGADGYSENATEVVGLVKQILGLKEAEVIA
ncbi:corrinoid protein [Facklamia sp. DSM 111018]|uniref:Corrinoid protein n=1 Tax=Facklamia lactis TaxID=2749967 RepID=A0ABS0LS48_9LACT|nr:corrinoid protein [Facklamia lactis]MBG9981186.1 corrinoid protein [Facklamia lactis]MBG9986988.1 corrinoid protein [Facklamia lactis]